MEVLQEADRPLSAQEITDRIQKDLGLIMARRTVERRLAELKELGKVEYSERHQGYVLSGPSGGRPRSRGQKDPSPESVADRLVTAANCVPLTGPALAAKAGLSVGVAAVREELARLTREGKLLRGSEGYTRGATQGHST